MEMRGEGINNFIASWNGGSLPANREDDYKIPTKVKTKEETLRFLVENRLATSQEEGEGILAQMVGERYEGAKQEDTRRVKRRTFNVKHYPSFVLEEVKENPTGESLYRLDYNGRTYLNDHSPWEESDDDSWKR